MSEVEIPAEVVEAVDAVVEQPADVEARARDMGWKGKDVFKGDEKDFIDAAEFVRRSEEILPIMRAHNAKLEKDLKRVTKTLEKFAEHHSKTEARAYARALSDLEARQAEAVEANDVAAVRQITKEITDLEKDAAGANNSSAESDAELFETWRADNAWFDKDKSLRGLAIAIAEEIKNDFPDPVKQRAEIVRRVKAEAPEKFTNPRRAQAAAVEGAGAGPKATGKSFADLPADAKAMCQSFERDLKGFKRETYVKDYFAS
jgi:hypothetical protein